MAGTAGDSGEHGFMSLRGSGAEGPATQPNSGLRHLPQSPLPPTPPVLSGFGGDTEAKLWAIFTF